MPRQLHRVTERLDRIEAKIDALAKALEVHAGQLAPVGKTIPSPSTPKGQAEMVDRVIWWLARHGVRNQILKLRPTIRDEAVRLLIASPGSPTMDVVRWIKAQPCDGPASQHSVQRLSQHVRRAVEGVLAEAGRPVDQGALAKIEEVRAARTRTRRAASTARRRADRCSSRVLSER